MEYGTRCAVHVTVPGTGNLFAVYKLYEDNDDSQSCRWQVHLFQTALDKPVQHLARQLSPCPYPPKASWSDHGQNLMMSYTFCEDEFDTDEFGPYLDSVQIICMGRHALAHREVCSPSWIVLCLMHAC